MDVRIGITHTPKELEVEMPDDADRDKVVADHREDARNGRRSALADRPQGSPDRCAGRQGRLRRGRGAVVGAPRRVRRPLTSYEGAGAAPVTAAPGLLDLRLVFVTGKGGVGKTTVAAGLSQLAAEHGKRVLVCEVDAKGDVTALFEAAPTDFTPREIAPGVWSMSMDTEASLREYLKLHLRIPVVGRIGPLAKAFDFVATAAPGVREILTVGKLCWEVREAHYDIVVVDAPASGHIVGQLGDDLARILLYVRRTREYSLGVLNPPKPARCVAKPYIQPSK